MSQCTNLLSSSEALNRLISFFTKFQYTHYFSKEKTPEILGALQLLSGSTTVVVEHGAKLH